MSAHAEFEAASCTGKVRFDTYGAADRVQARRAKNRSRRKEQVYRCRLCQGFHIGRRSDQDRPKHEFARFKRRYEERAE